MDPWFLDFSLVNELHERSLQAYGGSSGCRDRGAVESALGAAEATFFYGQGGVFDIAAAYAFHTAQAQAFLDGNKRTAIVSALAFLAGNGINITPTPELQSALYDAMIAIAERRLDKAGLAQVLRSYLSPT